MTLTKRDVRKVIDVYIKAWETQDEDLILTIFTEDATYHERVMRDPIPDRDSIGAYWRSKVVEAQANITCKLVSLYLDGYTAIAEWDAEFDDLAQGVRKHMKEIAVLEFESAEWDDYRITALREYWASETVPEVAPDRVPGARGSAAGDWGLAMAGDHAAAADREH